MTLKIGQKVQFVTTRPGHEGEVIVGTIVILGDSRFPCNPSVMTELGRHEVLAKNLTVIV
jgi:hypothetical protein